MNGPLRGARAVAVLGVAGLALTACGGGGEETAAEPSASESGSSSSAPAEQNTGDGVLTIGSLLPQTGSLAFLGPPEFAGVELAISDINAAGGFNGQDVGYVEGDSGDATTDIASQTVQRLLGANADAIVGAASSGVSQTVIDAITGAGVVQFSPANTSPVFTDYEDDGLYFRTAPSDVLQGRVMGDLVVSDGHLDVALLTIDDPYGSGLAENITSSVEAGGGSVVANVVFNPDAPTFDAEVSEVLAAQPEALVVIGFDQTVRIVNALVAQGSGPQDLPTYFVDGNLSNYGEEFAPGTLEGVKGTLPGSATSAEFQARLKEVDPALNGFEYAPEAYDATVLIGLAANVAGSDAGTAIAAELQGVSREGTACTSYEECAGLLDAGEDIDYNGFSGPVEFDENGDPTRATIGIYQYGPDNMYSNIEYREGSLG
ncbi:ABC transporter substrate-binding protein [Quadrisphaera sp. DSM 44207]|uniref:ABC transporter substrate-binding protein n=1 Tax=Quadrisphaera sp. DSM 44207 TaxID=1881057 RepID=UPI00088C45F1|nr:ABC transporter substrate-binding protein [Quadrisphaera sp. DSM 44207]SDQ45151.1 amino acid/amide ABC transporter substrate-binding protein, HAAT family [Quadrisphaera sp. DSM 44207]